MPEEWSLSAEKQEICTGQTCPRLTSRNKKGKFA